MSEFQQVLMVLVIGLVLGLAVGGGGVYYLYNDRLQAQAEEHEDRLLEMQRGFDSALAGKEQIIFVLERDALSLEAEVAELRRNVTLLSLGVEEESEEEIAALEGQVSSLLSQVSAQNASIAALEEEVESLLDFSVIHRYSWTYERKEWALDLDIPMEDYWGYRDMDRASGWQGLDSMCSDPGDDAFIDALVEAFASAASKEELEYNEKVNLVAAFIHDLPYNEEKVTQPYDGHPRYPLETLFDRGGDCGDASILAAAILDAMGYDVAIIVLEDVSHVAVGVADGKGMFGAYYDYLGTRYFYLEATGDGWKVGEKPSNLVSETVGVYPVG